MRKNESRLKKLENIYASVRIQLDFLSETGAISEYYKQTLIEMSNKVIRSIAKNFARTRERISDVMGGKILEYEAKTILNQGREEGVQECAFAKSSPGLFQYARKGIPASRSSGCVRIDGRRN